MGKILSLLFVFAVSFFLLTCTSYNDINTATVTIDTGIGSAKAAAPTDVTSISVTVSGSGMSSITDSIPISTGIVTLQVPLGTARLFSVTAVAGNFVYTGTATQDITETADVDISITMAKQVATLNITIPNQSIYATTVQNFIVSVGILETDSFEQAIFTPSDTITMEIPPGNSRGISLITTPLSQSAVVTFSTETATADFTNGLQTSVTLTPVVSETKIVIPDATSYRIVQIDDITGTNPISSDITALNLSSISISTFSPYDVDFDSAGRIYVVNYDSSTSSAVIRIDNVQDTAPETAGGTSASNLTAITIDRNNNLIYYASAATLYRNNLTNTAETSQTPGVSNILGLAVDDSGMLYIACNIAGIGNVIAYYNPVSQSISGTYVISTGTPWDVLYKPPYVYAANFQGGNNNLILRLDTALTSATGYGTQVTVSDTAEGAIYGPRRFVAILNRKITIVDDYQSGWLDKLISIDDITGTINWATFGDNTSSANTEFNFYTYC